MVLALSSWTFLKTSRRSRAFSFLASLRGLKRPFASGSPPDATARPYDEMRRRARPFLERRRPVILDATHLKREQRQRAKELAQSMDVPFLAVECVATGETVRERLQQRESAVWSPSDGRWEVYEAQTAGAEPLSELPEGERLTLDGSLPLAEQIERVLARAGA